MNKFAIFVFSSVSFILGGVLVHYVEGKQKLILMEQLTKSTAKIADMSRLSTENYQNCKLSLMQEEITTKTKVLKYLAEQNERGASLEFIIDRSALALKGSIYNKIDKLDKYPDSNFKKDTINVLNEGAELINEIESYSK